MQNRTRLVADQTLLWDDQTRLIGNKARLWDDQMDLVGDKTRLIGDKVHPIFGKMNPGEKNGNVLLDSWERCLFLSRMKQDVGKLEKLGHTGDGWGWLRLKRGWGLTHCMFWIIDNPKHAMR